MPGIVIHLSGPLMSFGEHSQFTERDTHTRPTRSALIGLLAAAHGRPRSADITDLTGLRFTIRVDRPGQRLVDFHTIGGGLPQHLTVPTAKGDRKEEGTATIVTRRHYLADAAFTVAVDHPDPALITEAATALRRPRWPLYLGRRACPPAGPVTVSPVVDDAATLLDTMPLHRTRPYGADTVPVVFAYDHTPHEEAPARSVLNDQPVSFHPHHRAHRPRTEYVTTRHLPADLCAGYGTQWLNALADHQETAA
ncbi:hypothetical protein GCM10020367_70300 [Streptomyces sannanensis]|uniref:Type I-E CRISPR-associated protein Cas5/CasD n=1 Tax=Streptomyces sannanensis TaxID=285536 RepID=A0ABP6SNR2_9ACTN